MQRLICHVDMDAFFVSVEELYDPSLIGKPVIVGGQPGHRGVVAAASYAARKFGVHSAMSIKEATQLCPHAIFLKGSSDRYRKYSKIVFEILNDFTPQVEMASIDEAYLDLTGTLRLHGPPLQAANRLHAAIKEKTNLNCSLGLATSRLVAKVASDAAKPHGMLWVPPGQESRFLAPLEIRKIPGIGKSGEVRLHQLGIRHVGDLARLDSNFLSEHFGKWGLALAGKSAGTDSGSWFDRQVAEDHGPKSISHENTFSEDVASTQRIEAALWKLSEMVARRLREHGLFSRTLQLKLRYSDFSTITRAHTLDHATQLDREIGEALVALFYSSWDGNSKIRLLGVHAGSLTPFEGQMNLLEEEKTARLRHALQAVDHIRDRFGDQSISLAKAMTAGIREKVHENPFNLPGKDPKQKRG